MRVTHAVRYDAPVDVIYAMLTDPVFRERAAEANTEDVEHGVGVSWLEGDR